MSVENITNKLAQCGTDGRLLTTAVSAKFKVAWHKIKQISNIRPNQI